jgi:hypothetical protein
MLREIRTVVAIALCAQFLGCDRGSVEQSTESSPNKPVMTGFAAAAARTGGNVSVVPLIRARTASALAVAMGADSTEVRQGLLAADPTSIFIVPAIGDTAMERLASAYADAVDREYPGYKLVYLRNLAESRGLKGDLDLRPAP